MIITPRPALAPLTTLRLGGYALAEIRLDRPEDCGRLPEALAAAGGLPCVLGGGSNLLIHDGALPITVLRPLFGAKDAEPEVLGEEESDGIRRVLFRAGAGMPMPRLLAWCAKKGLSGLEGLIGVPGRLGGAVAMNAGAYGGELKDVLTEVTFLDETLKLRTLPVTELAMGYRTSVFEKNPSWCVVSATVTLQPGDAAQILAQMQDYLQRRKDKQPLEWPSAGSTFKRPQGAFAGKLIEECGLRGFTVGGAQISEKHCGFVINKGGATCADVVALTEEVKRIVREKTGFVLEREIRVVR